MEYKKIAWDHQSAKPHSHSAPTPLDLAKWISDTIWPMSYKSQREFCGLMFRRNSGCVTTIHRSSFPKATLEAGRLSHQPNDEVGGRDVVGRWHTHIRYIVKKGDSAAIKMEKDLWNTFGASVIWDGVDKHAIDRTREFFPGCAGFIISERHIGIYDPASATPEVWIEYTRNSGGGKKRDGRR